MNRTLDSVGAGTELIAQSGAPSLLELRRLRLQELIRSNRATVESDGNGLPVRRGILAVINPDPAGLQATVRAGFRVADDQQDIELGLRIVSLVAPSGMTAKAGLKMLHTLAPSLQADFDHLYEPAGGSLAPVAAALAATQGAGRGPVIGMIDGGVASHPSLAGKSIEQNGFAGAPQATGHGTAVASLLWEAKGPSAAPPRARTVRRRCLWRQPRGRFRYRHRRALGWLSSERPQVINISLVGPPNKLVAARDPHRASAASQVVAAVGNDGPAAPPQYPASYPGVIAVTAVDAGGQALPEAGKAAHLDFAAPGADMAAALPGNGYARVRGTSFAAPWSPRACCSLGHRSAGGRGSPGQRPGRPRHRLRRLPHQSQDCRRPLKFRCGMKSPSRVVLNLGASEAPGRIKENDMTKFLLAAVSAIALGATPAQAQLLGNVGGTVSGALNGTLNGTLRNTGSARRHAGQRRQCRRYAERRTQWLGLDRQQRECCRLGLGERLRERLGRSPQ